jgi:hypothetical protein
MRVQLEDRSCVCLLLSFDEVRLDLILATVAKLHNEDDFHPALMLQIMFEGQFVALQGWPEYLRTEVKELETATGMIRTGRETTLARKRRVYLGNRNKLLKQQHAVRTELAYCEAILTHIIKFGASCTQFLKEVEDARSQCGHEHLKAAEMAALNELVAFTLAKCDFTNDKLKELTSRIEAQINVVSPRLPKISLGRSTECS